MNAYLNAHINAEVNAHLNAQVNTQEVALAKVRNDGDEEFDFDFTNLDHMMERCQLYRTALLFCCVGDCTAQFPTTSLLDDHWRTVHRFRKFRCYNRSNCAASFDTS